MLECCDPVGYRRSVLAARFSLLAYTTAILRAGLPDAQEAAGVEMIDTPSTHDILFQESGLCKSHKFVESENGIGVVGG